MCHALFVTLSLAALPPEQLAALKLSELVKLHRAYELPLPPAGAKLCLRRCASNDPKNPVELVDLDFAYDPNNSGKPTRIWRDGRWDHDVPEMEKLEPIEPDPSVLASVSDRYGKSVALAVQCAERGWTGLAAALLVRRGTADQTCRQQLALDAWNYWEWEFRNPHTDRAKVARRIRSAVTAEPKAFDPKKVIYLELDFLKHLELSLKPSRAKPGSLEWQIDELMDLSTDGSFHAYEEDPRYLAILDRGFDAVPTLIDHLDDHRPSRVWAPGFMNCPGFFMRVRHFTNDIVCGYLEDVEDEWREKLTAKKPDKTALKKLWAETTKAGEEGYAVAHVLGKDGSATDANSLLLRLIERKYPKRLPEVFGRVLVERPNMELAPLAAAVARTKLPDDMKKKLYQKAIDTDDLDWKRTALLRLADIDRDRFHELLLKTLARLSASPEGEYHYCAEARMSEAVNAATDPKVWDAAEKYLRKADAGVRLEWFEHIKNAKHTPATRRSCLAFVSRFLDDITVRDPAGDKTRFGKWYAGQEFKSIEVRNYAAVVLGDLLDLKTKGDPDWAADQWESFREEVSKAAKKRD